MIQGIKGSARKRTNTVITDVDKVRSAIRARMRFKALVRKIIENRFWLQELDPEEDQLGENVLKNIILLTRKREKSPLALKDKALLNIPTDVRTEEDKAKIKRAIGGLKCFRRYPAEVKAELAAITYFAFFGPGRIIVKQDQPAYAMYFLLNGEVGVTQRYYDRVSKEWVTRNFGVMGPGTMFGEVALLLGISRTATITTTAPCELLKIQQDDFDRVLKATVAESWASINRIMERFTYFEGWDSLTRRECCIMSRLKEYPVGEIIFGGDIGLLNYVYFVIEGTCSVVEHLMMKVFWKERKKVYKMYEHEDAEVEVKERRTREHTADDFNVIKRESDDKGAFNDDTPTSFEFDTLSPLKEGNDRRISKILRASVESQRRSTVTSDKLDIESLMLPTPRSSVERKRTSLKVGSLVIEKETLSVSSNVDQHEIKIKSLEDPTKKNTVSIIEVEDTNLPSNVETHFIEVCELHELSCFNVGETFKRRHVIAKTQVQCLLIPRYWLLQKNHGNIWNKVIHYLDKQIPTSERIFTNFLEQKKWIRYKKNLVKDIMSRKAFHQTNTIQNVPYSIRIKERANNV